MLSGIVGLFLSLIIPAIIQLPLAWVYQSDIVYERITTSGYRGGVAFSTDFYALAPQLGFSRIPKWMVFFVATIFIFLVLNALLLALNFGLKYLRISTSVSQEQVRSPIANVFKTFAAVRIHPLIMLTLVASISFFVFAKHIEFFKAKQGQKIYRNSEQMLSFIDQKTLALTNPQQMFLLPGKIDSPKVLIIGEVNLHQFASRFFQSPSHTVPKNEVLAYTVVNPATAKVIAGGFTELNIDDIFFNAKDMQMLALADGKTILYHKKLRFIASLNADYSQLAPLSQKPWLRSVGIDKPIKNIHFNPQHQANVYFIDGTTQTLDLTKNVKLLPSITRYPKHKNPHYSAYWKRIGNSARYSLSVAHRTPRGYGTRKNYQDTVLLKPKIKAKLNQGMLTTSVEDLSQQAKHRLSFISAHGDILWALTNLRFETVINHHPRASTDYSVLETSKQFIVIGKNHQNSLGLMAVNKNTGSTLWRYTVPHNP